MGIFSKILFLISGLLFFDIAEQNNTILFLCIAILFVLSDVVAKRFQFLCYVAYIFLCIYDPKTVAFLPLFIYDLYFEYKIYAAVAFLMWAVWDKSAFLLAFSCFAFYLAYTQDDYSQSLMNKTIQLDNVRERLFEGEEKLELFNHETRNEIEIAILNERNRIAREIHDSVGHSLSSCILQTEALKLQSDDEVQIEKLETLQQTLQNGMQDIRSSLHNLHDSSLDLKRSMENILAGLPLQSSFDFAANSEMDYSMKIGILSAFKEMLANIAKHSDAKSVRVRLMEHKNYYSLSVKDDGTVKPLEKKSLGIGLHSIADFAKNYNGNLYYGYEQDGFFVHITLSK